MEHSSIILLPTPPKKSDCSNCNFAFMIEVKKQLATQCDLGSNAKPCNDKWTVWHSLIYEIVYDETNKRILLSLCINNS